MPARHYRSEYVEEGVTILLSADETPGPGITHDLTALGLPQGTHSGKVVLTPLVGGEPVESNSFIHQIGNPTQVEPVTVTAAAEVTLADVVVRRDALLAAAGIEASAADTAAMNEALLVAAGASATVVDNKGIRVFDDVQSSADVTTTLTAAQIMREQLAAVVVAADSVSVMKLMLEQVQAAITASATVTDSALRTDAASVAASVVASVADTYTPGASAPTQPVISATGGDTTVTIALTSGGTGATSYDLKWGTAAGSRPNTISGVTLPYTHTGRTNGTTYYYSLVATNAQGSTESAEVSAAAVAASVSYSDNFNRADGGLGSNWTTVTGKEAPVISSQKAGKSGLTLTHAAFWSANTFANDQWAIARVYPDTYYGTAAAAANSLAAGPAVRCSSGSMGYHASALNYYDSDMEENGFVVSLWRNGTFMQYYFNANAPTPNEYSHIKISAVGTTVTVYGGQTVNGPWDTLVEISSSNISSGSAGTVIGGFTYSYVDDWSGGDV